jgi:hypothetical protein
MKKLLCTLVLAMTTAAAKADSVTITFDQPNQIGSAGQTLQFFGTIVNNTGSTIFLNGDSPNMSGLSFTILDQFFTTVPISLDPGKNSGDIELFDIAISSPLLDPGGKYTGSYTLLGGTTDDAQNVLGTSTFSVSTPVATPEPGSIYLLLGGVPVAGAMLRRLRTRA